MKALALNILFVLGFFLFMAPVRSEQIESVTTDKNIVVVELTLGSDDGYVWGGRSYQLSDLLPALRAESKTKPFKQINLGASTDMTVQNIIDVATLAKDLAVDAYYQDGDELKRIEINE